ncbi:MAG: VOC family protein [Phycisphaerales bacterium]|nr:VOC family protein [Phycisphaerales bacterium]
MINAIHTLVHATDADSTRAFFRDTLGLKFVEAHPGWLIFALPPAELGIHPAPEVGHDEDGDPSGTHRMYLMCDDVHKTVAELRAKGVEFTSGISDQGWGLLTTLRVPGAGEIGLYQPRHPLPSRS